MVNLGFLVCAVVYPNFLVQRSATQPDERIQSVDCTLPVVSFLGQEKRLLKRVLGVIHEESGRQIQTIEALNAFQERLVRLESSDYCVACKNFGLSLTLSIETASKLTLMTRTSSRTIDIGSLSKTAQKLVKASIRESDGDKDHAGQLLWFLWFESVLDCLDSPYNYYVYADQLQFKRIRSRGKLFMPGFSIDSNADSWTIGEVMDGRLQEAGVSTGDQVIAINNEKPNDAFLDFWLQESPFEYHLTVNRGGHNSGGHQITVSASGIPLRIPTIAWFEIGSIVYLRFSRFSFETLTEFRRLNRLLALDERAGLIIDLRGNPGGAASPALVDCLLKPGQTIMSFQRKEHDSVQHVAASVEYVAAPLVILVDRNSASMSEVFAAAIKMAQRGYLIGENTVGKCVGQTIYPIKNEGELGLAMTKYFFPDTQESWCDSGVVPDEIVELDDASRIELNRHLESPLISMYLQKKVDPAIRRAISYLKEEE